MSQREPVERRGSVAKQSPVAALDMQPPGPPAAPQEGGLHQSSPRRGSVVQQAGPVRRDSVVQRGQKGPVRRGSMAAKKAEREQEVAEAEEGVSGDGVNFPVQLCFREGDTLGVQVRKTPSWPRSSANSSLFSLPSHRNAWANLHIFFFYGPTLHLYRCSVPSTTPTTTQ